MSPERRTRATGPRPAPAVLPTVVQAVLPTVVPATADPIPAPVVAASEPQPAVAQPIPFDRASDPDETALTALTADLAAAGRRARSRKAQATAARPEIAFAEQLRARLLTPGTAFGGGAFAGAALAGAGLGTILEAPARTRPAAPAARSRGSRKALRAWAVFAVIVVLLVAATGLLAGRLVAGPLNRTGDVAGATLIRAGASTALLSGTALAAGDEIRVGSTGRATLLLGSSQARLAAGADVQLVSLSGSALRVALTTGREYNRVSVPAGGSYAVVTGPYAWTATGTAFDLDSSTQTGGGTQITLLTLEHSVAVTGPAGTQVIPEGSSVTAIFGSPASDSLTVGPIPATDFADPWLIANAKTDEAQGYPIGALAGVALAPNGTPTTSVTSPSAGPTESPTDAPSDTPGGSAASPSPTSEPSDTPVPTPRPTPTPTTSPSPTPTPTATPPLGLSLTACPGGVVLNWSKYSGPGFARYVTLRSSMPSIPPVYDASKVLAGTSTTSVSATTGADPANDAGATYFYRTLALGSGNKVLQASQLEESSGSGQFDLGPASVVGPVVVWSLFNQDACFSEYKVVYSGAGTGSMTVSSRVQTNTAVPDASGFGSGDTISFRIQVVRTTATGQSFVVAQTTGTPPSYTYP